MLALVKMGGEVMSWCTECLNFFCLALLFLSLFFFLHIYFVSIFLIVV